MRYVCVCVCVLRDRSDFFFSLVRNDEVIHPSHRIPIRWKQVERGRGRERERKRGREKEGDGRFSLLVGYHGSGNATDLFIFCRVCAGMQLTD